MNISKKLLLIGFCLFVTLYIQAQDQEQLLEEYCKIYEAFTNNTKLAYSAEFKMYDDLENDNIAAEMLMEYRGLGKEYYCQFETYELYRKGKEMVYLDNHEKQINFVTDEVKASVQPGLTLEELKDWIKFLDLKAEQYTSDNNLTGIRFISKNKTKSIIALEYDPVTFNVHKTIYAMDLSNYSTEEREDLDLDFDNVKMEVKFYDFKKSNIVFPNYLKKMIQKKDKPSTGKYANYEVNHF